MIRIYKTTKGIIITDEENKSVTRPGYALATYYGQEAVRCRFTKELITPGNTVEERCANGDTIRKRLDPRSLNEYPVLESAVTITHEQYAAIVKDFEHPGCVGKALSYIGIKRTLQDVIAKNLDKLPAQRSN